MLDIFEVGDIVDQRLEELIKGVYVWKKQLDS